RRRNRAGRHASLRLAIRRALPHLLALICATTESEVPTRAGAGLAGGRRSAVGKARAERERVGSTLGVKTAAEAGPAVEAVPCPLCRGRRCTPVFTQRDLLLGGAARYTTVRCEGCRVLYQNPRLRVDDIALAYPDTYAPRVREPSL